MNDLKFAFRQLLKNPGFTAVAVLTLALGIGANTAMFSVVHHVLLSPLSFSDARQLVAWWFAAPPNMPKFDLTEAHFAAFRDQNQAFESTAAYATTRFNLAGDGQPERLESANVTADFLRVLGIRPAHGRTFLPEEDTPGRNLVCLISHSLWQRRFGGDPNVIGRSLNLDEIPTEVIGIMPSGFEFPHRTDLWVPVGLHPQNRGFHYLNPIGRLKPGVSSGQAQTQLEVITQNFVRANPDMYPKGLDFATVSRPLKQAMVGDLQRPLLLLLAAVGLLLLVACANVANLLLARATERAKEIAIRFALGASRQRVIVQSLTEHFVLAALGASAGLLLAYWGIELLGHLPVERIPRIDEVRVDKWTLSFTLALTVMTTLIFGLAPAGMATSVKLDRILRESFKSSLTASSRGINDAFVVLQFALSLVLLIGAGLLLRSFQQLLAVQPGFRAENVLALEVSLPGTRYTNASQAEIFYTGLRERALALPGVRAAGLVNHRPLTGKRWESHYSVERPDPIPERLEGLTTIRVATPGYFDAMGISVLRGRSITEGDRADSPLVVVVDEPLARRHWPGDAVVGQRLRMGRASENNPWMTIVGVVPGVKDEGLAETPAAHIYRPYSQSWQMTMDLAIRAMGEPAALAAAVRKQVAELDSQLPINRVETMEKTLADSLSRRKSINGLLVGFASVALILASVGIYGVTSLNVRRRRLELGIRIALGAPRSNVLRMVLSQGMKLASAGIVAGLAGAVALTNVLRNLLFGISPTDLFTFVTIPLLLAGVALLACWLPARRAAGIDPMEALRCE